MRFNVTIDSKFDEGDTVEIYATESVNSDFRWPIELKETHKGKVEIIKVSLNFQYSPIYLCEFSNGVREYYRKSELREANV